MLHIRLFGHLKLKWHGAPHPFAALPKTLPLLAYLLLNKEVNLPRDAVAAQIWPDVAEKTARGNLRRHLYELRRVLPEAPADSPWILSTQNHIQWNPEAPFQLDVAIFKTHLEVDELELAIAQYDQDLLPELYEEWLVSYRDNLRRDYLGALELLVKAKREAGQPQEALGFAKAILQAEFLREDIVRTIMSLQSEAADRAGALQTYTDFADTLLEELGVEPMAETAELYAQILDNVATASISPYPLPAPLTNFFGRELAIAELTSALCDTASADRLWTLTGPGGSGKTRLSLEVARHIRDQDERCFSDGICFVDLSVVSDPDQLVSTIARALQLDAVAVSVTALMQHLTGRQTLLILDNFEQILDAAPLLPKLLAGLPELRILVTSRAILNVYGERDFAVSPLPLPSGAIVNGELLAERYPAIALFVARAQAIRPEFVLHSGNVGLIREICQRLDGLPLAIELAAARLRYFSLAEILEGLADALTFLTSRSRSLPQRQKTIRDAIGWSYELLSAQEKELFAVLSLFAGSISLAAVEALFGKESRVMLDQLSDQSLLIHVGGPAGLTRRWRFLATIQEFAREQFALIADRGMWQRRYIDYFVGLAVTASGSWQTKDEPRYRQMLRRDNDNLWTTLQLLEAEGAGAEAIQMAVNLTYYWIREGHMARASQLFAPLVTSHFSELDDPHLQGMALRCIGNLNVQIGEYAAAHPYYLRAQEIYESLNDLAGLYVVHINLGVIAQANRDALASKTHYEQALPISRQLQNDYMTARVLHNLSTVYIDPIRDLERAEQYAAEALALYKALENGEGIASMQNNAGIIAQLQGDYSEAAQMLAIGLEFRIGQGYPLKVAQSQCNLGFVMYKMGNLVEAKRLLRESLRIRCEQRYLPGICECVSNLALIHALDSPVFAVEIFSAADKARHEHGINLESFMADEYEDWQGEIKHELTRQIYDEQWRTGQNHTLASVVAMLGEKL